MVNGTCNGAVGPHRDHNCMDGGIGRVRTVVSIHWNAVSFALSDPHRVLLRVQNVALHSRNH